MEYIQVKCKNCGSNMNYKEGMTHIKCPYCGSEYILNNQKSNNEIQTIDYAGRGPLFETYVPKGWTLNIFDDNDSISSLSAICKGLQLSHNNHAQLIFILLPSIKMVK